MLDIKIGKDFFERYRILMQVIS